MKKLFFALAAMLVCSSALAQGTINFNNRVTGQVDAPIRLSETVGFGSLSDTHAQLFQITGGPGAAVYTPIGQSTTFRAPTAANPLLAAYINPISSMVVDGVAAGTSISVVMRVWQGASYDAAASSGALRGQTGPITISLGGDIPNQPPATAALLIGLQGLTVPEPSTGALVLLGAAALLYRRRS